MCAVAAAAAAQVGEQACGRGALGLAHSGAVERGERGQQEGEQRREARGALLRGRGERAGRQLERGELGQAREEAELLRAGQRVLAQRELRERERQRARRRLEAADPVAVEAERAQLPAARQRRQRAQPVVTAVKPAQPRAAGERVGAELGQLVVREVE